MSATTIQHKQYVVVVSFNDTKIVDSQRIEEIGRELQAAVGQATHSKLLLNFKGVTFMSSAIITKLVLIHKLCKSKEVALKLCSISPNVMEVFKITKLNKLFDSVDDEQKAMASF